MPFLDPNKRREYRKNWYKKHSGEVVESVKERKLKIKKWLESYKKNLKCSKCSEDHPATIDFHHKKSEGKENDISYLVSNGYSIKHITKELKKCEILCSNCHRKQHYENNKL